MVIRISGTQPQGPKYLETLENKTVDGTQNTVRINRGTTGNRPISPVIGDLYFDTTLNALIQYNSLGWVKVSQDPAPTIASISPTTAATTGTVVTITGTNFKSGLSVQFTGTDSISYNSPIATFVNGTSATATTPNLSVANEPYDVKVTNSDNQFGVLDNCLDVGGTPSWNTSSGNIATIDELTSLNVSVSATDPDGTSIVYSSSNLPVWVSLNSSSGALTGTSPDINSDTTYSFDVTATDGVNSSSRSFNILSRYIIPGSYESIASSRLTSNSATVTFSSIPQTFKHLQLRWYGGTQGGDYVYFTTNLGNGGRVSRISNYGNLYYNTHYNSDPTWGNDLHFGGIDASNYPAAGTIDFLEYSSTTKGKSAFSRTARPYSPDAQYSVNNMMGFKLGTSTTTALTSITMQCSPSYPFKAGSTFSLYGIRG